MVEEWANQLLYGGSDLLDELTERIKKQKEDYIVKSFPKDNSSFGLCHNTYHIPKCIEYVIGEPVNLTRNYAPFEDGSSIIIESTDNGISKILEMFAFVYDMKLTELKNQEEKCVMESKNDVYYYDNMPYTFSKKNSEPTCIDIDKVIFNKRTTVILWTDGTKTKIRCSEKDQFDEETAVAICMIRKILGPGYKRAIRDILKTKAKRYE